MQRQIPKIIHYCRFGEKPLSTLATDCIRSWKKFCPDYTLVEWNESNFPLDFSAYTREAASREKWAFVADVARLYALAERGGIYLDTDVELKKPLEELLQYNAFAGFESSGGVSTALLAASPKHPLFIEALGEYTGAHFIKESGTEDLTTNVVRFSKLCQAHGLRLENRLQTVDGLTVFPLEYFSPKEYATGRLCMTENTFAVHHYEGSWLSEEDKLALQLKRRYAKFLPRRLAGYTAKLASAIKSRGWRAAVDEAVKKINEKTGAGMR